MSFNATFSQKNLETFVEHCYDLIALLLCYHISLRYMLMCHKRAVPALDNYWNKMEPIIMARYLIILIISCVAFDLI